MTAIQSFLLCVLAIGQTLSVKQNCHGFESADRCMQELLLLGNPDYKFPMNDNEMDSHCGAIDAKDKCLKDYYLKCSDAMARHVSSVFVQSTVKSNKHFCTIPAKRQAFLRLGQCANPRKTELDQLMYDFIDSVQGIINEKQTHKRLPLLCCNYHKFKALVLSVAENDVEPKCSDDVVKDIEVLIDGFANSVLNLICPIEFSEEAADKCDPIVAQTPKKTSNQPKLKSLLLPLIDIFDSLKH